jgi:hypothetical protein
METISTTSEVGLTRLRCSDICYLTSPTSAGCSDTNPGKLILNKFTYTEKVTQILIVMEAISLLFKMQ